MTMHELADLAVTLIEGAGILVIVVGALAAGVLGLRLGLRGGVPVYQTVRQSLARAILLGLELLVAADIIHTVAIDLTLESVGVLAVIVLIRTFLSFSLGVEVDGYWPWQKARHTQASVDD